MARAVSDNPPQQLLRCSICYNPDLKNLVYITGCNHIMHSLCLQIGLRALEGKCPTCSNHNMVSGSKVTESDIIPIHLGTCPEVNHTIANNANNNIIVPATKCAVCLEPKVNNIITLSNCGHTFHKNCISLLHTKICPICRNPFTEANIIDLFLGGKRNVKAKRRNRRSNKQHRRSRRKSRRSRKTRRSRKSK